MFYLILIVVIHSSWSFSCKNQDGDDVDWFAVYKMPLEARDSSIPGVSKGLGWYYVDVNRRSKLQPSQKTLDDKNQAIAYTLQQFYDRRNDPNVFHVMFNDEPYNASSLPHQLSSMSRLALIQYGHTKGTIFFDSYTGVWLIHSVPKFPPSDHYEYPLSGHDYGQTMLCLTLKYTQLPKIGTQLYYNRPNIYSSKLPTRMAADCPDLAKAISGQYKQGKPYSSVINIVTAGGSIFKSFAKTNQFNADLYDSLVAPTLLVDIIVESWRRGSQVPLSCSATYHANDALEIQVGNSSEFKYTKDHSKMARSADSTRPWVCIGDINRMTSQYIRGGGTNCISSSFLWKAFNVIKRSNTC